MSDYISTWSFGEALAHWKREAGWSDTRICDKTGLDRTTVAAIRNGKNEPQWRTRVLLWEKLPGFRTYCRKHAPHVLDRFGS